MRTYSIIKRNYGVEMNQVNKKTYTTKEAAINAGNSWLRDCRVHAEIRKGWNFEVIENSDKGSVFTGIGRTN